MTFPFLTHDYYGIKLCIGEYDMDFDGMLLHEALYPVYGLNKVVELIRRPNEDCFVAMALKVTSASE